MAKDKQGNLIYPTDLVDYQDPSGEIVRSVVYTIQPDERVQINTNDGRTILVHPSTLLIVESLIAILYDEASRNHLDELVASTAGMTKEVKEKKARATNRKVNKITQPELPMVIEEV